MIYGKIRGVKKIVSMLAICVFVVSTIMANFSYTFAFSVATNITDINKFPDSYKSYIKALKAAHPNWNFVVVDTHLDWNYVISQESVDGRSLVPMSYGENWKDGNNTNKADSGWINASDNAIRYTMDPRNFLNEEYIFQFEDNSFNANAHTPDVVEQVLYGSPMSIVGSDGFNKYTYDGQVKSLNNKYSNLIYNASNRDSAKVSPVHLASRILQENGGRVIAANGKAANRCLSGSEPGYIGYYNYMNIGAGATNVVVNSLNRAKEKGWTSPELGINGAADFLQSTYIKYGQNTIYFEKFDVRFVEGSQWLFGSQYMTNILAPSSESSMMYKAYKNTNKLESNFTFYIPYFDNMPQYPVTKAFLDSGSGEHTPTFVDDSTLIEVDTQSNLPLNVRYGPSTDSAILCNLNNGAVIRRIAVGNNCDWDRVELDDGRVGYVFKEYIKVLDYVKVESISLDKLQVNIAIDQKLKLNATINPANAKVKDVVWNSSNKDVVDVDQNGNLTAKKIGESIITVTTKDQKKSATCKVNVVNPGVESISLDKKEYNLLKGNLFEIVPVIKPDYAINKEYTVTIDNTNIAEYKDGKIIAKSKGETNITFTTKDSSKTATAKLIVSELSEDFVANNELKLDYEQKEITKIQPGTKVSDVKSKLSTKFELKFKDVNGKELTGDSIVGTGTKIELIKAGKVECTFTIVIYGDVNGDGSIDVIDLALLKRHLMGKQEISSVYNKAGILQSGGTEIDVIDLALLKRVLMGKFTINT